MAKKSGPRRSTGRGRNAGSSTRATVISGMVAGSNGDLISQSGGVARTFQSTNGSKFNSYGPGATPNRSLGVGGWIPGWQYTVVAPGGDGGFQGSTRRNVAPYRANVSGNKGPTNASIRLPKVLGPKGFGGNYRLSNGY